MIIERPILFSGAMVKAILEGRKTQTRRVVKPQPTSPCCITDEIAWHRGRVTCIWPSDHPGEEGRHGDYFAVCPYGKPGDRLWVREAWCHKFDDKGFHAYNAAGNLDSSCCYFRADGQEVLCRDEDGDLKYTIRGAVRSPWLPSIHMPRWASRITLEVTEVRVQRLQEISNQDAAAEGIREVAPGVFDGGGPAMGTTARHAFMRLWDSINAKWPGCVWEDNPWLWAISFRRVD